MKVSTSFLLALGLAGALCLAGCAGTPAAASAGDEQAIRACFDKYVSSLENYDADGWMALWDEDGVQLPPNAPMFVGKAAIKEANYEGIKDTSGALKMSITTQEVIGFGGHAMARGVYSWVWTPKDGSAPGDFEGKFMTIFKKQPDGAWRIFRDCFNSNRPPEK